MAEATAVWSPFGVSVASESALTPRATNKARHTIALEIALLHPEYHSVLDDPDRYREQEYFPEFGEANPFLHMSLHMALEEQLSIDQPAGVVERFSNLVSRTGDRHAALHEAVECLGEMVWRSQRDNAPPDATAYLANLDARARK